MPKVKSTKEKRTKPAADTATDVDPRFALDDRFKLDERFENKGNAEDDGQDDEQPEAGPSTAHSLPPIAGLEDAPKAPLTGSKTKKSKTKTAGVVYVSRVPPGMTPHKVRHLMARWGEVGRVYAQRRDAPTGYNPNHAEKKKQKHQAANFTEAWVEFLDKNVAKTVASMLNAQAIGGKKGDRWRDDVWTMQYLSGFKWEMLGEQVAYERQVHQSRLRAEITRAKADQGAYLQNVELARVLKKREDKASAAAATVSTEGGSAPATASKSKPNGGDDSKGKRSYKQRAVADRAHGLEAKGMDSVLGSIFG